MSVSPMTSRPTGGTFLDRRSFLQRAALSGGAIALLAGQRVRAAEISPEQDAAILNAALSAEHEAVAAYQVGAESGLLAPASLKLAVQFQGHHKAHVEMLASTIEKLGGEPARPLSSYDFPVQSLKREADVLEFAAGLERGAVSAYLGAVPIFADRDLAKAAASILGDEAMHWAVLRHALGQDPVPVAFVS